MTRRSPSPVQFSRGRHLYQIARDRENAGLYVGYCDGRKIATGREAALVARLLIDHRNLAVGAEAGLP